VHSIGHTDRSALIDGLDARRNCHQAFAIEADLLV